MKTENSVRYILRLALTLLLICAVVAGALAGVNTITKDRIAERKAEKTQKAIAEVLPGAVKVEEVAFTDTTGMVTKVYRSDLSLSSASSSAFGYAVEVTPSGFGGNITMMVGVSDNGEVLGIAIISHTETPGLGAVSAANNKKGNAFRAQFLGLAGIITIGSGEGQVDALSGATITSQAVVDGVNAALECIRNMG